MQEPAPEWGDRLAPARTAVSRHPDLASRRGGYDPVAITGVGDHGLREAVGPEPVAVHEAPPSVLFQTAFSVAPYRTPGAAGEAASARTCAAEGPSAVQVFGESGRGGRSRARRQREDDRKCADEAAHHRNDRQLPGRPSPPQRSVVDPAIDTTATNTGAVTVTLSGAQLRVKGKTGTLARNVP